MAASITFAAAVPALGQFYDWTNSGSGAFHNPSNWYSQETQATSTVVPGTSDSLFFSLNRPSPHTVTFSAAAEAEALLVRNDQDTLDLGGHTLTLNRPTDHLASLVVGESDGQRGDLFVTNGTLDTQMSSIAYRDGSTGNVTVNGAQWINHRLMQVGSAGRGSLTIANGGYVESNRAIVGFRYGMPQPWEPDRASSSGRIYSLDYLIWAANFGQVPDPPPPPPVRAEDVADATSVATVTIDGADSSWHVRNNLYVGPRHAWEYDSYKSVVELTNGGELGVGRLLQFSSRLGVLDLTGGRAVVGNDDPSFDQSGTLYVGEGGTLSGVGYIDGDVVVAGGIVAAGRERRDTNGNEPLVIGGDLTLSGDSLLSVDILPRHQNPLIDGVQIGGLAELAGTLQVDISERIGYSTGLPLEFDPVLGTELPLLEYGSYAGQFDNVVISGWESDEHRLVPVYDDNALSLIVSTLLDGDANGDNLVDGRDFVAWASAFGAKDREPFDPYSVPHPEDGDYTGDGLIDGNDYLFWADLALQYSVPEVPNVTMGAAGGDFNHDGVVDGVDYLVWVDEFTGQPVELPMVAAQIPEPSSWALACISLVAAVFTRRRSRSVARQVSLHRR